VIVQGALQVIAPSSLVEGRVLEALNADGTRITIHESLTDKAEAEFVVHSIEKLIGGHGFFSIDSGRVAGSDTHSGHSFSDFAVLYRTDAQGDLLCEALGRSGIPFGRHTHTPLAERRDVQALLARARNLSDELGVLDRLKIALGNLRPEAQNAKEVQNSKPERSTATSGPGFSNADLRFRSEFVLRISDLADRCRHDFARFESEIALLSDADLCDPRADRVSLLTLHASKGLEFAVVFIVGCEDGLLPLRFGSDDDMSLAEERRLFFVGMTRARERLVLSHAKKRLWRAQLREQTVSPFVTAIEKELLERTKAPAFTARPKPAGEQLDLFGGCAPGIDPS
jgi:DNA helicase-2/ATP-dependent DNA helicase PcrA